MVPCDRGKGFTKDLHIKDIDGSPIGILVPQRVRLRAFHVQVLETKGTII
jgi:hypothetical protein